MQQNKCQQKEWRITEKYICDMYTEGPTSSKSAKTLGVFKHECGVFNA